MNHIGILLAAGAGNRFGGAYPGAKLDQPLDGVSIGVLTFEKLSAAVDHIVVVARDASSTLSQHALAKGASVLVNGAPDRGMGHSLATAMHQVQTNFIDAKFVWVLMADLPFIKVDTLRRLRLISEGDQRDSESLIVRPVFVRSDVVINARGARNEPREGHPVIFGHAHWSSLAALDGDEGARSVVRDNSRHQIFVETDDEGICRDVDTPADLASAQRG